jgi:hypothetical protein
LDERVVENVGEIGVAPHHAREKPLDVSRIAIEEGSARPRLSRLEAVEERRLIRLHGQRADNTCGRRLNEGFGSAATHGYPVYGSA